MPKKLWKYDFDIAKYTKAIELNPNDIRAYNNRAIAYFKKGGYDLAISDFNRVIELNPAYDLVYVNRGSAYQAIGHYDNAIADFTTAAGLNPKNSMAYNNRGFCYLLMGNLNEAEKDIGKALEISQWNLYALNSMAELCAVKNIPEDACKWLRKAIDNGFNHWSYLKTSKTYDNIRNSPCFIEIISRHGSSHPAPAAAPRNRELP